jgi:hypothetical protein
MHAKFRKFPQLDNLNLSPVFPDSYRHNTPYSPVKSAADERKIAQVRLEFIELLGRVMECYKPGLITGVAAGKANSVWSGWTHV